MQQRFRNMCLAALLGLFASCSSDGSSSSDTTPSIVVTYSAIGDVVSRLVGDAATVTVLIPNGQDQHDFMPSAQDVETINNASLVVSNGLDLEEGLEDSLLQAEKSGVPMFHIADHVTLLDAVDKEEGHEGEEDHGHGTEDPHVWLDPETIAESIPALAKALQLATGKDFAAEETAVVGELTALSAKIREIMTTVDECKLVTGHDSLGYFVHCCWCCDSRFFNSGRSIGWVACRPQGCGTREWGQGNFHRTRNPRRRGRSNCQRSWC
ncbi:MAG: hypothetical protein RL576_902 [Actinomycetota bacterium]